MARGLSLTQLEVNRRLDIPPRYPVGTPVKTVYGGAVGVIVETPAGDVWCVAEFPPMVAGHDPALAATGFDNLIPLDRPIIETERPLRQLQMFETPSGD